MKLRAQVKMVTGNTRHLVASGGQIAAPAWVEIEPQDGAFYLFYLNANGVTQADTWHQTLEAAKGQALFEFKIGDADWTEVTTTVP